MGSLNRKGAAVRFRAGLGVGILAAMLGMMGSVQASSVEEDEEGLDSDQIHDVREFALGNARFFLFHEAGHMLISELDLPVLGREEDAVDMLATLLMLHAETEEDDQALVDSVDGWTLSSQARYANEEEEDLSGPHALDEQRAYNMTCLMVGKDQEWFTESADDLEIAQERRDECRSEYELARKSWFGLLERHQAARPAIDQFKVIYRKPQDPDLSGYMELARKGRILERLAEALAVYRLPRRVRITAMQCDEANAYWSPDDLEITFCYELAQAYLVLLADYFREEDSDDYAGDEAEEAE